MYLIVIKIKFYRLFNLMKKHRHLLYILFTLLFLSEGQTFAQSTLRARVLDSQGAPVEYANVILLDHNPVIGSTTDRKGSFELKLPSNRDLHIRVSFVGYEPIFCTLNLKKDQIFDTILRFNKHVEMIIDVVVVHGEKNRNTTFTGIEAERLEKLTGPNEGVEALIKTLPDVQSNNELSSQYSVRGGSFDENLVYINDIEVYRPMLIRSGQQEGMSIINPDLVDHLNFSPGGFDATFGDKMSSVLDLVYSRPTEFKAKVSASLLGATASLQGTLGKEERMAYSLGFRQHSNSYLFRSLDTKGIYNTNYTDFQGLLSYRANNKLDISLLSILSRNIYGLIPRSQSTLTGGFYQTMNFEGYFDGEEKDKYRTALAAVTFDYHPTDETIIKWITSMQSNSEQELYDIQCQYWLYEVNIGATDPDDQRFERGVGTYLEHARNYLNTTILSSEVKASHFVSLGQWDWGLKYQREWIDDRVREWRWVDSAGYAYPVSDHGTPGDPTNLPTSPLLQNFCSAHNNVATDRYSGYLQRSINFLTRKDAAIHILLGLRGQLYSFLAAPSTSGNWSLPSEGMKGYQKVNSDILLSPRISLSYKPQQKQDIVYKIAAGIYHQPPFYREYRSDNGSLNFDVSSMHSYQVMGSADWNFTFMHRPCKFTADLYYKYITDLVPYRIDNLRVRYDATNEARAYATGLSLRVSSELIKGLESWASLSLMQTQEDLLYDTLSWLARPTDQRFSFKLFLQDHVPGIPFWRMSLNLIYGSRMPYTSPRQKDRSETFRMPAYYRIDWGNTIELAKLEKLKDAKIFNYVDDINLSLEVFNLLDYNNAVSYTWVADYNDVYYHIPNFLTRRQLNFKITVTF